MISILLFRYFKEQSHLVKLRNVVCSYVWTHMSEGYSQGMCDLLAPLMVIFDDEALAYACYLKLMESAIKLFPPNTGMNTRLANIQSLLQVKCHVHVHVLVHACTCLLLHAHVYGQEYILLVWQIDYNLFLERYVEYLMM